MTTRHLWEAIRFLEGLRKLSNNDAVAMRYGLVLMRVAYRPGISHTEIESLTGLSKTVVYRAIQSLVEAGLVTSGPDTAGLRFVASLTPKGKAVVNDLLSDLGKGDYRDGDKGTGE